MRTVVLVHGAWHGAWCWAAVLAGLDERGVPAVPVELPGPELAADVAAVEAELEHLAADGRRVVLVGHSYGGAVVTEAGAHPVVERLVYIAGFALDDGESAASVTAASGDDGGELASIIERLDDGRLVLDPAAVGPVLYGDCRPDDVERAASLLRPQALATLRGEPAAVGWRMKPTTYAVCGADRAVSPDLQRRMAARIPDVALVEWPGASHSPMLSRPGDVADLLAALAEDVG
jgi:pimeloyl-ACP methyl ester carboxylesterase